MAVRRKKGKRKAAPKRRSVNGGVDVDAMKKRYEDMKKRNRSGGGMWSFWKPDVGDTRFRLLPPETPGGTDFFLEVTRHFIKTPDGKSHAIACNAIHAEDDCYFCEMVEQLKEAGDKNDAREMRAQTRCIAPIVLRQENGEDETALWTFTVTTMGKITSYMFDAEYEGLTDPDEGFDLILSRTGKGRNDTRYDIRASRNRSSIGDESVIENRPSLDEMLEAMTYDYEEQRLIYEEGVWPEGRGPNREDSDDRPKRTSSRRRDEDDEDDEVDEKPFELECFGEYDRTDAECRSCPDRKDCRAETEDEDEDDDEEEEAPRRRSSRRSGKKPSSKKSANKTSGSLRRRRR